jgi:hypothetical protein
MANHHLFTEHPLAPVPSDWLDVSYKNDLCPSYKTPCGRFLMVSYGHQHEIIDQALMLQDCHETQGVDMIRTLAGLALIFTIFLITGFLAP